MTPQIRCISLSPVDIDLKDTAYCLRPSPAISADQALEQSIRTFGILHPPLLLQDNGRFVVLSGRKRIATAQRSGLEKIPSFILDSTTSPLCKLENLLAHALIGSSLSIIEQAVFFAKAAEELSKQEVLYLLPLLGIKPHSHNLREFAIYLQLEQTTIHALHSGLIHPKTGIKLMKLTAKDQQTITRLINYYSMGGSKQHKLVDYATELIMRTNQPLEHIVEGWQQENEQQENRPQQAMALLSRLEELCFPSRTSAEKNFAHLRRSIQLPENVTLQHTPSFEDDRLILSISFDNQEAFCKGWDNIKKNL